MSNSQRNSFRFFSSDVNHLQARLEDKIQGGKIIVLPHFLGMLPPPELLRILQFTPPCIAEKSTIKYNKIGFPFAKLLRKFCGTKRKIFLSLRISFPRKKNNLRNHSQKSFRAKLPYSAFAKLKFCAIPQFRTKIRNRLSSKSLDNFSFGHAYFLKVDSSGIGYFLASFL